MADAIEIYQEGLVRITDQTEAQLGPLWAAWEAGTITEAEFLTVVTAVAAVASSRGAALASLVAATVATRFTGADVLPRAVLPSVSPSITMAGTRAELAAQLRREVYDTASLTWTSEVFTDQRVSYWTRRAERASKCAVCTGLANGYVLRSDTPMRRHKGCRCVQQPAELTTTLEES